MTNMNMQSVSSSNIPDIMDGSKLLKVWRLKGVGRRLHMKQGLRSSGEQLVWESTQQKNVPSNCGVTTSISVKYTCKTHTKYVSDKVIYKFL